MFVGRKPKFCPGTIVGTRGVLVRFCSDMKPVNECLQRHLAGDWGDADDEDTSLNKAAFGDGTGTPLRSAYKIQHPTDGDVRISIVSYPGDRTCVSIFGES
ncbi:MAG: hypothetical protein R3E01_29260 [Pirellulaceae bacterium]|nr:hypothetical protein [Planctomycetales bacterium]